LSKKHNKGKIEKKRGITYEKNPIEYLVCADADERMCSKDRKQRRANDRSSIGI
jgi:hypothetical protein